MTSKAERRVLLGQESDPGNAVTPEIALRATADFKAVVDKVVVEEDIGSFAPARSYLGSKHGEGSITMDGNYQQVPYIASMALGDITPTGSDPYTWSFPWPDATAPTFSTYTMEYTDGGSWVVKCTDVFATSLEITGEAGKSWMFKADLVGGEVTFPSVLADPLLPTDPTINAIKMADTTLTIDDSYGDISTTPVTDAFISFTWKLENLQHNKLFAGNLYPTGRGNDKWQVTLEIIMEVENAVAVAQRANLLTDVTYSAIRIQASTTPFTGITWISRIDGNYMLDDVDTLDDRDGNNIVKFTYRGEKDADDNTGAVYFVNDLSDLATGGYWYD